MMKSAILAVALAAVRAGAAVPSLGAASASAAPVQGGIINLSCMEALVAVEQARLAGVFSFIPEKDSPAAFGDLVAHDGKALKRYADKLDQDFKAGAGITAWDHEAVVFTLSLFSSPLAQTLDLPAPKLQARLTALSLAPTVPLGAIVARRKK